MAFSFFGNSQPAAPAATPSQAAAPSQGTPPAAAPAGTPGAQPPAAVPAAPQSPMDRFGALWQTGAPDESQQAGNKAYVSVDPAKLGELTGRMNFTAGLKPEQVSAVFAGGDQAVSAFQQALNSVAQQTFQSAMLGAQRMLEQALQAQRSDVMGELPSLMKNHLLSTQTFEENPALSHPSVRPLIEVLQAQFAAKFPEASLGELRKMAADYLTQTAGLFNGQQQQQEPQGMPGFGQSQMRTAGPGSSVDWDNFFSAGFQ